MAELAFKEQSAQDVLVEGIDDPRIARAGLSLISQHRRGNKVDLVAFDKPHAALATLSEQLESLGLTHELSEPFIDALRRYLIARGAEFSRTASAKPVRLHLVVSDGLPDRQFENGLTEITCIGAEGLQVQGVAGQNVRATISGTATTSNAADVDAMFANVRGLRLWFRCEAPTKEDLDGLMTAMESALAGVAQAVGGSMSAEDFKNLLDSLEAENALTPQMEELIESMIALQKAEELGLTEAQIGQIVQNISALIADAKDSGLIPATFIEAATKALSELSSDSVIRNFLVKNGFEDLMASNDNAPALEEQLSAILEKIEALQSIDGIDPAILEDLGAMAEELKQQMEEGAIDPATMLNSLSEKLMDIAAQEGIPQELFNGIGEILPEVAAAKEIAAEAAASAPSMDNPEAMLAMLEDIAAKIESGELLPENVPPELMAVIETLGGVEALTQEQGREARLDAVAAAIDAPEGADLGVAIAAAIEVLSDPAMVEQLPPALQEAVQTFNESAPDTVSVSEVNVEAAASADISTPDNHAAIETSVNLSETFAHPDIPVTGGAVPANDMTGMSVPLSPVSYATGGFIPSAGGSADTVGWSAPIPVVTVAPVLPVAPLPVENKTPSSDPVAQKESDKPKEKNVPDQEGAEVVAKTQPKDKLPDSEKTQIEGKGPEVPANDPVPTKDGPCKDICPCDPKKDFRDAAGEPNKPEREIVITPEVKEIVKNISAEIITKYGGEKQVAETIADYVSKDSELLKHKTPEQILHQAEQLSKVEKLLKPDENTVESAPIDTAEKDADIVTRLKAIKYGENPLPPPPGISPAPTLDDGLTKVHGHVCGSNCKHGEQASYGAPVADTFEGGGSVSRRRGRSAAPQSSL